MEGSDSGHEGKARGVCIPPGTICTNIAFAPSSGTALQVLIGELIEKMADLNLGLYAAYELTSKAPQKGAGGSVNWQEVVKRYEASRHSSACTAASDSYTQGAWQRHSHS